MPGTFNISVVVPTYQRRARVMTLIESFRHQTFRARDYEVVVCVNGSTDGTVEALEAAVTDHALRVVLETRPGRSAALNAGIRASRGELVVLLDDDMEPVPEFLAMHWSAHLGRDRIGVMGAVPVAVEPAAPSSTRYIAGKFNRHLANLARPEYRVLLTDFFSGNFSIRRQVLHEAGGFDEDFQIYGNEDLELSFRLAKSGVAIEYSATALAIQRNDKAFAALVEDSIAEGRTAVVFAGKHPDAVRLLKLGSHAHGSIALRWLRNVLLRLDRRWPGLPVFVIRGERQLARIDPPGMTTFYRLALGHMFWVGVQRALADQVRARNDLGALSSLAKDLRL